MADGRGLTLLSLDRGDTIELTSPPEPENDRAPAFSPDGTRVAFVRDFNRVDGGEIRVQPVDGGEQDVISFDKWVNQLAWAPSGQALVCAVMQRGLWWVPLGGKAPTPLGVGDDALHVSIAPSAEPHPRMVFTERGQVNSNIYRMSGPAASEKTPPAKLIVSTRSDFNPDISPDGTKIAFMSSRSGERGIWVCVIGDDESCFELSEGGITPRWSPDGARIAYRWKNGIFVVDAPGGIPVRLTDEGIDAGAPSWSSDGSSIYFSDLETGIWKMPVEGGEALRVMEGMGGPSRESEDGRFLYFWRSGGIWRVPTVGGDETPIVENRDLRYFDWTLWKGNVIFATRQGKYATTIHRLNVETGEEERLASLPAPRGTGLAVSPDGQWLFVSQQEPPEGDLMLVELR